MTANEWYRRFDGAVSMDVIKSIQDDSRAGMIEVSELDQVINAVPFPLLKSVGAEAMAWHSEQGEDDCGITKSALAKWLRDTASQLSALDAALTHLKALRNEHT